MTSLIEPICETYDPDTVFQHFRIVEFPMSIVGLSTSQKLDLNMDYKKFAYLRTVCDGKLMKFEKAREISASHRAFTIEPVNSHVLDITFKPINECVSRAVRQKKHTGNRFVFDLRLIKTHGTFCCNDESHSEIGRYYISGQYEYHKIVHYPNILNFEKIEMNDVVTRHIRIHNQSKVMAVKMNSVKCTGFTVSPHFFTIRPNSSKRIGVTCRPCALVMTKNLIFNIRNPNDAVELGLPFEPPSDDNYLTYSITVEAHVVCKAKSKEVVVQSLHNIYEPHAYYTFLGDDLITNEERKKIALQQLQDARMIKPHIIEKISCNRQQCYSNTSLKDSRRNGRDFCKNFPTRISNEELFDIFFAPTMIDFGHVSLHTYGEHELVIKNKSKFDVKLKLLCDNFVVYTDEKLKELKLNLAPLTTTVVNILCYGCLEGSFKGTFLYTIDNEYERRHPYVLDVGNPKLIIQDAILKFGMVTSEAFVTSLPIKLINKFNVDIDYEWAEFQPDTPFEVTPTFGTVPKNKCKYCDCTYVCKPTKTKVHEIQCQSKGLQIHNIPVELNVVSRKLSIKFLEPAIYFKDIALNLECAEKARLENSSREIALFYVIEPLLPGVTIEPMNGIICPKMIITFDIMVKISCVLEFTFEVVVKINSKENVTLTVGGNVVEPKLTTHPKYVLLPRVPCGMIAYIPVTFQNTGPVKLLVEVLETDDENIFNVYTAQGNDKEKILEFYVEASQSKTVFVKVYDVFRREYDMYIPFKVNRLIGPPTEHPCSTELRHYIGPYEEQYQNNVKVKLKSINKDITYFRMTGVITVPWLLFSEEKFEIQYEPNGSNCIDFTMANISKYNLFVTVLTSKLTPNFSLVCLNNDELQSTFNETLIKFELGLNMTASFRALFHPKTRGRFIAVALLYLDRSCTLPYHNLTFDGKRQIPALVASTYQIIFPPSPLKVEMSQTVTLKMEGLMDIDSFTCSSKEERNLNVSFVEIETREVNETIYTIVTVLIKVNCATNYSRQITLDFHHECGSLTHVDVSFCYTFCLLTLHIQPYVSQEENPYPFYPLSEQHELFEYMERCTDFLEKWMFLQGFRRDLYPKIPDTFYAISSSVSARSMKGKGINVSFLNFFRRIAGPLTKYLHKISVQVNDEALRHIVEIHETYKQIIHLLKARGTNLPMLQARFLLPYNQFVQYSANSPPRSDPDAAFVHELISNPQLFDRLGKQTWFDFILQCYKVFVIDSCFFDCVCVTSEPRNIINIILQWYNEHILIRHKYLRGNKPIKHVTNLTADLSDGIAIISVLVNHCPFMISHFSQFCEIDTSHPEENIINNACLILEAMTQVKIFFPLTAKDFLKPNFLHMLFLSVHLNVTLPMYEPKDTIEFLPALLKSSTRQLAISPLSQESLSFNFQILNNTRNNFSVEKVAPPPEGNEKKNYLNIKFTARFVYKEKAILLIHGYNKTRLFDTYMIFNLVGYISCLNPIRKYKMSGLMYRPSKADILVCSPFTVNAVYELYLTDIEPTIPVTIPNDTKKEFYVRRLNLIDKRITLLGYVKENQDVVETKLYLLITCLSSQTASHWIWFLSDVGQFFMRITTQPRWDLAVDSLTVKVAPIDPCSCGEACECYRTTVITLPHRNDFMLKALRFSLSEHASDLMLEIYDELIESSTGQIILRMLFFEGGTNMSDILHILRKETTYRITSRNVLPRLDGVTLQQHTGANFNLPVTIPANERSEKYTLTLTSECGMDIRVYRICIVEDDTTTD